jgi:hypothetical protein
MWGLHQIKILSKFWDLKWDLKRQRFARIKTTIWERGQNVGFEQRATHDERQIGSLLSE